MTAVLDPSCRKDIDIAPIVRGLLSFAVKGAHRLVKMKKDELALLESLFVDFSEATDDERPEIVETMLEVLVPEEQIGNEGTKIELQEAGKENAEKLRRHIGETILKFRKEKRWTQLDLATKAQIPQSHVSRLETGMHAPTHLTIERIAKALGVKAGQIDPNYPEELEAGDNEE